MAKEHTFIFACASDSGEIQLGAYTGTWEQWARRAVIYDVKSNYFVCKKDCIVSINKCTDWDAKVKLYEEQKKDTQ
jgi:lipocalin